MLCHCHPQDGIVNPTVRKNMKGSQKLYCCPMEGCPRGPNRPFSQFSLVKQVSLFSSDQSVITCGLSSMEELILSTKYVTTIILQE